MVVPSSRYRLGELISDGAIETWSGLDETLHRPVTIRIVDLGTEVGQRLRMQALALARLEHPGLLHVLDTSADEERFAVITEALPPVGLADELHARGHFPPAEAVAVAVEVGEALGALHRAGFAHGGVTPDRVGRRENSHVVIMDGPPTSDAVQIPATPADDVRSLGVLTHLMLVGNPPITAPDGHHDLHPAIPPPLAPVLQRALDEEVPWPDATGFVLALKQELHQLPSANTEFDEEPPASFFAAERAWFTPAGILLLIAAVIAAIGVAVTRTDVGQSLIDNAKEAVGFDATTVPESSSTSLLIPRSTAPTAELTIIDIVDFDPIGEDRSENPDRLALINDGDLADGWYTERYSSSDFGRLKEGVGLILTFGPPQQIDRIRVGSPSLGWSVQVYASENQAGTVDDWGEPIAALDDVRGAAVLELEDVVAATMLVWITDLGDPLSTGGYRVTITDISVSGRPIFG
jgi:serine/threonine protein kinase